MIRFYFIPFEIYDPGTGTIYQGPKYFRWRFGTGIDCVRSMIDYGRLVGQAVIAADISQTDHDSLILNTDVYSFPENIDQNMSPSDISTISNFIESIFVPADWMQPNDTFRYALKTVTAMFLFMQGVTSIMQSTPEDWGIAMNTRFDNYSAELQAAILQTCASLDYDDSVIRDNWTTRILLKNMADQWGVQPIHFGFVSI